MSCEPRGDPGEAAGDLPGYISLLEKLERTIETCERRGRQMGLLLVDLSGIDLLKPSLGYRKVSELLDSVQARLLEIKRPPDSLLRINDHRFAMVIPDLKFSSMIDLAANRITETLGGLRSLTGLDTAIHPKTGIALYPKHGRNAETLLLEADTAIQAAQRTNVPVIHAGNSHSKRINRSRILETELEAAFRGSQFELYYQPKIDLFTRQLYGAESLIRWNHPAYGLIRPKLVIPVIEKSHLLQEITLWALNTALHQAKQMRARSPGFRIAVNLSPGLLDSPDLVDLVTRALRIWDTEPQSLILEVTETSTMVNQEISQKNLRTLSEYGVLLSIDDFGTGYSSYSYLQQLPVQEMKIDRSFISDLRRNSNSERLVKSMIGLGRDLGINVLAEGVETPEVVQRLQELGCRYLQGYLIGRPMPFEAMLEWIDTSGWKPGRETGTRQDPLADEEMPAPGDD